MNNGEIPQEQAVRLLSEFHNLSISPATVTSLYHTTARLTREQRVMLRLYIFKVLEHENNPDTHAEQVIQPFIKLVKSVLQRSIDAAARKTPSSEANITEASETNVTEASEVHEDYMVSSLFDGHFD
jgi:hypothetical protein